MKSWTVVGYTFRADIYCPDHIVEALQTYPGAYDGWKHCGDPGALARNGTGSVYGPTPGYDGDHDLGLAYCVTEVES